MRSRRLSASLLLPRFAALAFTACGPAVPSPSLATPPPAVTAPTRVAPTPALSTPSAYRAPSVVYTFDRNALVSSVTVGPFLVALTRAGHVLRFDRTTLALQTELLSARRAVVLGAAGAGAVLVGYQSGRIAKLDVATLALETVASVPGIPLWLGATSAAEIAVVHGKERVLPPDHPDLPTYAHRLTTFPPRLDVPLPGFTPSAFFLDHKARLWIGSNHEERGGDILHVDLAVGAVRPLSEISRQQQGVLGFTETSRGEILAFGGVFHLGLYGSFLTRVAPDPPRALHTSEAVASFDAEKRHQFFAAPVPRYPITHVVERPGRRYWVLDRDRLFDVDSAFERWSPVGELAGPDPDPPRSASGGSLLLLRDVDLAVRAAHLDGARLILATAAQGLASHDGKALRFHALPDHDLHEAQQAFLGALRDEHRSPWRPGMEKPGGLRGAETARTRDLDGRVWLGGEGLWILEPKGNVTPVLTKPGLGDYSVVAFERAGDRLHVALGVRGYLGIRTADIEALSDLPAQDPWDLPRPHEPHPDDGAVGLAWRNVVSETDETLQPAYRALRERLKARVLAEHPDAHETDEDRRWLWRVPSATRLADFLRKALESEAVGPRLRVEVRFGREDHVAPAVPTE